MLLHDAVQAGIDFFGGPAQAHGVLAHFQTRGGHATGVRGLAGCVQHASVFKDLGRFVGAGHVGAFGHADHTVLDEGLGVVLVQFVLCGAGQRDVHGDVPRGFAGLELSAQLWQRIR